MSLPPKGRGLRVLSQSQTNTYNLVEKTCDGIDKLRVDAPKERDVRRRTQSEQHVDEISGKEKNGKGIFNRVLSSLGIISKEEAKKNNINFSTGNCQIANREPKAPFIPLVDFNILGVFNEVATVHTDFDNDILNYSFHIQARNPPNLDEVFEPLGGERVFSKVMNHLLYIAGMVPIPTEVVYLAAHYLNHTIAANQLELTDLDVLVLSAIHLAAKAERQAGFLRCLGYKVNMTEINRFEMMILRTLSFKVLPVTTIQFMRILFPSVCGSQALWIFAKFLSQLVLTNTTLANLSSPLQAGVVMRLVSYVSGNDCWNDAHYEIVQEDSSKYEDNINILCRLLLVARENQNIYEVYARNDQVVERIIQARWAYFVDRASRAMHVNIYEKKRVEFQLSN